MWIKCHKFNCEYILIINRYLVIYKSVEFVGAVNCSNEFYTFVFYQIYGTKPIIYRVPTSFIWDGGIVRDLNKASNFSHRHDDVIKWKHFSPYWPCVKGIHRIPLTKASDAELLMIYLIYAWTNVWANTRDAGDLRRHHAHYDVTVMDQSSVGKLGPLY